MRARVAIVVLGAALVPACAFDAGHGFATIVSAEVSAALVPGAARDLGGGVILTDLAYHVQIASASLALGDAVLEALAGTAGGGGVFDPADPPPGYSLCHSGHCHHESGRLVDYEEIQAELSGGSGGPQYTEVARMPLAHDFDLTVGESLTPEVEPSAELPRTTIARATVAAGRFALAGTVTAGPLGDRAVPLQVAVDLGGAFTAALARPVDREHDGELRVHVAVELDGALLDGVDFIALEDGGTVAVTSSTSPAYESLASALLEYDPKVTF